jgi:hypothetical protein
MKLWVSFIFWGERVKFVFYKVKMTYGKELISSLFTELIA